MKSFFQRAIITIAAVFVFAFAVNATAASVEHIQNFDETIDIRTDGSILVNEKITYDFDNNQKHGIFRDIPLTSKDGPEIDIDVNSITDGSGNAYKYSTSFSNKTLRLKIGDANKLVGGTKTYEINYTVYNAIRSSTDHDELYWNVTGNDWPVGIDTVRATIKTPSTSTLSTICFTGAGGSQEQACTASQNNSTVNFTGTRVLRAGEGMTVAIAFPKGIINNTYQKSSIWSAISDFFNEGIWILFLIPAIVILGLATSLFSKIFRPSLPKELKNRPIVTEYNPPDGLKPIELGTLYDRRTDLSDISSIIIDLAQMGYLKIHYTEKQLPLWPDRKDYELARIKNGNDLSGVNKIMYDFLFNGRDSISLSNLKKSTSAQEMVQKIKKETFTEISSGKGYMTPFTVKSKNFSLPIMIFAAGLILGIFHSLIFYIGLLASLFFAAKILAPKLTPSGIHTLAKIFGFREFLKMTEQDRLRLLNAPELKPETFEKFLSYAMVLGVEEQWAKKFEGIYNQQPNWYESRVDTQFSSLALAHSMKNFHSSFTRSVGVSSSSSSGFSGGHSGGGSGGGGGGSW